MNFLILNNENENGSRSTLLLMGTRFWASLWDLIQVNLLFMIFSLPIVTMGCAMAGLTEVTFRLAQGNGNGVWQDFKTGIRKHGIIFTGYVMVELAVCCVLLIAIVQYGKLSAFLWAKCMGVVCIGILFFAALLAGYLHSLRIRYAYTVRYSLKCTIRLLLLGIHELPIQGIMLLIVWFCIEMLPYSLPLLLLIIPASACFISCFATLQTTHRYMA